MNETLSAIALMFLGALFLGCLFLFYRKGWKGGSYFSAGLAAFFFAVALPPTRDFLRTSAWAAFVTAMEATGQGLVRLHQTIDEIRAAMEAEQQKREVQQHDLDQIQTETREMQKALKKSQEGLDDQQRKLADVNQLLKSFYEAGTTETLGADSERLSIISHGDGGLSASVYALLSKAPIPQTLQLQWHIAVQPRSSYRVQANLVTFSWADAEIKLHEKPLSFTYVPDPTQTTLFGNLEKRGHRVLVDGRPLAWALPFILGDPALKRLFDRKQNVRAEEIQAALDEEVRRSRELLMEGKH